MNRHAPIILFALLSVSATSDGWAQKVVSVQVSPPELSLEAGTTGQAVATGFDERGNVMAAAPIRWSSSDLAVASVEFDPAAPAVATVRAKLPGVTVITAEAGGDIRGTVAITVTPTVEEAPLPATMSRAVISDSVLAEGVFERAGEWVVRINRYSLGFAQPCRVGGLVGPDLVLTSYRAIRAADSVTIGLPNGTTVERGVRVAAYDAEYDLAVLHALGIGPRGFPIGDTAEVGDRLWVAGARHCEDGRLDRATVVGEATRDRSVMSRPTRDLSIGSPVLTRTGDVVSVALGDSLIAGRNRVAAAVASARSNVGLGALRTPRDVALAQRHAYGSVSLDSDVDGARVRISPMEEWHWATAWETTLPTTYAGPMGRYLVELSANGEVLHSIIAVIEPGRNRTERLGG